MTTNSASSLDSAITTANGNGDGSNTINFTSAVTDSIQLNTWSGELSVITKTLTITTAGQTVTIDGGDTKRIFASTADLTLENLTLESGFAFGGSGDNGVNEGGGGGGGAGMGGAIYIDKDLSLSLSGVTISSCTARGGTGGNGEGSTSGTPFGSGGGGGSFSSDSPDALGRIGGGDRPGGIGNTANGGSAIGSGTFVGYGGGDAVDHNSKTGGTGGGSNAGDDFSSSSGGDGGYCGGGGGAGAETGSGTTGCAAGGGNGGGDGFTGTISAAQVRTGGGGGYGSGSAGSFNGGAGGGGGFAGGGGGGCSSTVATLDGGGGAGGFGGGGGGGGEAGSPGGGGGLFAGDGGGGVGGGGGGGAGLGGAIFVADSASLTIVDSVSMSSNNAVAGTGGSADGGTDGSDGTGYANDIFLFKGASLTFNGSSDLTASFAIQADTNSGVTGFVADAGVTKSGSNTVTLSSTSNNYRGGTAINAGTLQVSSDSNLGASVGDLTFDGGTLGTTATFSSARGVTLTGAGTINTTSSTTFTLSGVITSSGAFTKSGTGNLVLSGSNDYTGGTTINAGTLWVSADNNLGDAAGDLNFSGGMLNTTATFSADRDGTIGAGGGTITTDPATTLTLGGSFTGTGVLTKNGTGNLTLTGSNDYSGGTTISAGTLFLSGSGALASDGDVTVTSTFDISGVTTSASIGDLSGAGTVNLGSKSLSAGGTGGSTFSGMISGANGTLTKKASGTLILSGTSDYTGATTVSAGTLSVMGDISASASASIASGAVLSTTNLSKLPSTLTGVANGTLELNNSGSQTISTDFFAGQAANFRKLGSGTLTLSDDNTYTGTTTINAGTLSVTGSISSSSTTTVESGATLIGNGTLGPLIMRGSHRPGLSIDTMTFEGNVNYNSGSTLEIEINESGQSDKVVVNGTVTINPGATLEILVDTGSYNSDLSYTFLTASNGISGNFGTFTVSSPGNIEGLALAVTINDNEGIISITNISNVFITTTLSACTNNDLAGMSLSSSLSRLLLMNQLQLVKQVQNQRIMRYTPCSKPPCSNQKDEKCFLGSYMAKPYVICDFSRAKLSEKNDQSPSVDFIKTVAVGSDFYLGDQTTVGFESSYQYGNARSTERIASINSHTFSGGFYAQTEVKPRLFFDAAVIGGRTFYDLQRSTTACTQGRFHGYNITGQMELSYHFSYRGIFVMPFISGEYGFRQLGSYKESTTGFNALKVDRFKADSALLDLGGHFWYTFCLSKWKVTPNFFAVYTKRVHGEADSYRAVATLDATQGFSPKQRNFSSASWRIGLSFITSYKEKIDFSFGYQTIFDSALSSYNEGYINMGIKF